MNIKNRYLGQKLGILLGEKKKTKPLTDFPTKVDRSIIDMAQLPNTWKFQPEIDLDFHPLETPEKPAIQLPKNMVEYVF